MAGNRPRDRQKNVSGQGKGVYKRGSGLGLMKLIMLGLVALVGGGTGIGSLLGGFGGGSGGYGQAGGYEQYPQYQES